MTDPLKKADQQSAGRLGGSRYRQRDVWCCFLNCKYHNLITIQDATPFSVSQTKTRTGSYWAKSEIWAESSMVRIYYQMVYKLYDLTEEEIAIVEESVRR